MEISPDSFKYLEWGPVSLNRTIVYTWLVMALLFLVSWLVTRRLTTDEHLPRWQNILESTVLGMIGQIREVSEKNPERLLTFLGSLFLFIALSNLLSVVPGFHPPTGSLSTTTALALCVFVAVPVYGISQTGPKNYLSNYVRPTPLMLPFNLMGEVSRTLALAVRLFGNVMSGTMVAAILLAIAPILFPVLMQLLGLLTGLVQAYIFAMLAAVYIAAGLEVHEKKQKDIERSKHNG